MKYRSMRVSNVVIAKVKALEQVLSYPNLSKTINDLVDFEYEGLSDKQKDDFDLIKELNIKKMQK